MLIKQQAFKTSFKVICGNCQGTGVVFENNMNVTCQMCNGQGQLIRETEGVMKLFTINTKNNDNKY